jgi:type II secretory pathway pseudopilin PulG
VVSTNSYRNGQARHSGGFTYLVVLFVVVLMGTGLAKAGVLWQTAQKRDREEELLFVGHQYAKAIELYYLNTPGRTKRYPRELGDLIKDARQQGIKRYLRKLYRDPITGNAEWGIVTAPDGGIAGVYSLSTAEPLKKANFNYIDRAFSDKARYSEWVFGYLASGPGGAGPTSASEIRQRVPPK